MTWVMICNFLWLREVWSYSKCNDVPLCTVVSFQSFGSRIWEVSVPLVLRLAASTCTLLYAVRKKKHLSGPFRVVDSQSWAEALDPSLGTGTCRTLLMRLLRSHNSLDSAVPTLCLWCFAQEEPHVMLDRFLFKWELIVDSLADRPWSCPSGVSYVQSVFPLSQPKFLGNFTAQKRVCLNDSVVSPDFFKSIFS